MRTWDDEENSRQSALLIFDFRFFFMNQFPPSPSILEKIRNDPNAFIRDLGEDDSQKTEAKNLATLYL
jgi:hypothetical protein